MSELSRSQEYLSFRSNIPLRKISVDTDDKKVWKLYDSGPKTIKNPVVCLPPASGTADIYFKQILGLQAKGFRVLSVESPAYWNVQEWCEGFRKLMDYLGLDKVHIFGASLGGFLAQMYAEYTSNCPRVASLILCNTFTDTSVFNFNETAHLFWLMPSLVLKRMIMGNFNAVCSDQCILDSVDFMVERVESLKQNELASRLTLNCINNKVNSNLLVRIPITVIDVFDEYALSNNVRETLYKTYPHAKLAHLKSGGNFPYLSRSDEINLHIQIHLRQFDGGNISAKDKDGV